MSTCIRPCRPVSLVCVSNPCERPKSPTSCAKSVLNLASGQLRRLRRARPSLLKARASSSHGLIAHSPVASLVGQTEDPPESFSRGFATELSGPATCGRSNGVRSASRPEALGGDSAPLDPSRSGHRGRRLNPDDVLAGAGGGPHSPADTVSAHDRLTRIATGGGTTDDPRNALPGCGSCLPQEPRPTPSRSRICLQAEGRASHPPADRGGIVTADQGMPSTSMPSTPQLLTIDDLRRLFRCGRTTAYARVREPGFPSPLVLSGSAHRWWQHEVLAWLEGHRVQRAHGNASGQQQRDSASARTPTPPSPQPVELRRRNRAR